MDKFLKVLDCFATLAMTQDGGYSGAKPQDVVLGENECGFAAMSDRRVSEAWVSHAECWHKFPKDGKFMKI